jgi:hypothetical protein
MPTLQAAAWQNSLESKVVVALEKENADRPLLPQLGLPENAAPRAQVLHLDDMLAFGGEKDNTSEGDIETSLPTLANPPKLGSDELPSVGSLGHHIRRCKPCSFVTRTGCANGVQCHFCHLCSAGEKKRRRQEKRALLGAARKLAAGEVAYSHN